MSNYMKFVLKKIKEQEKNNEEIVLDYWIQVSETGYIGTEYESLAKKIINFDSKTDNLF